MGNVNRPPVISNITNIIAGENEFVKVNPVITDPNGDNLTVSYFSPLNKNGTWLPGYNSSGTYSTIISAIDGNLIASATVVITIINDNKAPVLETIANASINAGTVFRLNPVASDPDNDTLQYSYSFHLNDNGTWQPHNDEIGSYKINVTFTDGDLTDTGSFILIVKSGKLLEGFDGDTTNLIGLSRDELKQIRNFTLEKSGYGKIRFSGEVNLSTIVSEDYSPNILLSHNLIWINTQVLSYLENKQAIITMYNLSFNSTPKIYYKNGFSLSSNKGIDKQCGFAKVLSYDQNTGTLVFRVHHFTMFRAGMPPPKPKIIRELKLNRVRIENEYVMPGSSTIISVDSENIGNIKLEDLIIHAHIPELGVIAVGSSFNVNKGKDDNINLVIFIPEWAKPGDYLVRVVASNDHIKRIKHRMISVR